MKRFRQQTVWGVIFLTVFSVAAVLARFVYWPAMFRFNFLSGWALFALMLFLALYNVRKKLPFLPLGSSETWLQIHIYGGWFSFVLFAVHLGFRIPDGWFETTLAIIYLSVFISGVVGLILSRVLPSRLTTRGGEIIFERIPAARRRLRDQAEAIALEAIPASSSAMLAEFYAKRLRGFFERRPTYWAHLLGDRRSVNALLNEIAHLKGFLSPQEHEALKKITQLVEEKDILDYHHVAQLTLKLWLFIHIPFTYSLLLLTLTHIFLVYSFTGRPQ